MKGRGERPESVVLMVLQGKESDAEVVAAACGVATRRGAALRSLVVLEIPHALPLGTWDDEREAMARAILEQGRLRSEASGCAAEGRTLPSRHAGRSILDEAIELSADVIVLAKPFRSQGGDAASYVMEKSVCPVLVWQGSNSR